MSRTVGQIMSRGEHKWTVRVYLGRDRENHKRKYYNKTVYGSLRQAQAHLTKKLHERDVCRTGETVQITLDEFLDHWLKAAAKPKLRERTYLDYEAMLRRYIRPHIGTKIMTRLSPLDIQGAYQQMIDRGLWPRTVRYTHAILRSALRQAIRWQLLLNDPTKGVQLPRHQTKEMRVMTMEQARAFLRIAVPRRYGCVFALALTTGMRPSEYLGLFWQDIDWRHGTVSIVRTLQRNNGRWYFAEPKRTRSRRIVKLQSWVLNLLKNMRSPRPGEILQRECNSEYSGLVFTTEFGEPINQDYLVKNHFKPILRQAGLPNLRLYDLRHTAATLALTLGIPPKIVSEQLGHASAAFTLDTYSHVLPHMQEEAAAKIEAALVNGHSSRSEFFSSSTNKQHRSAHADKREHRKADVCMARKLGQIVAIRENTWMVRIPMGFDPETHQRNYYNRTVYGSLRQAQKFLGKKVNQLGASRETDGAKIRLDQYLDEWLKTIKSRICAKTYESYESLLEKYIRPSLGKKYLIAIRPFDVQTVYQQMTDRGLSPRTVRGAHWVLNAAFRQALQWEMILEVPSKGVKLPRIRRREMQVFNLDQAKVFLKFALPTMYGTLFALAVTTGMRPSEYIGLKWQDIDWERGTVSVKRTLRKGPTGQWEYGETKRAGSRRLIRLQNWVIARLKELKELQTKHPFVDPERWPEAVDLIFVTEFGRPVNVNSLVYKHFKPILKRAGLPNIRLYDLRHTAATLALIVGVSPKVVSEQLGHTSAAFTLDVYSHVLPHMQDDAAAKVEAMLIGN